MSSGPIIVQYSWPLEYRYPYTSAWTFTLPPTTIATLGLIGLRPPLYSNPQLPPPLAPTWTWNFALYQTTQAPFVQTDWPLPQQPYRIDQTWTWRQVDKLGKDTLPFPNRDWPLPQWPYRIEQTTAFNPIYYVPPGAPKPAGLQVYDLTVHWQTPKPIEQTVAFNPIYYVPPGAPKPAGLQIYDLTPIAAPRLPLYTWEWRQVDKLGKDTLPFPNRDWPLPIPPYRIDQTWTWRQVDKLGLDTLPFPNRDWPLPQQPYRIDQTWVWRQVDKLGQDRLPTGKQIHELTPDKFVPYRIEQTWTWRQVDKLGQDTLPFPNRDWPLPTPPFRMEQTWLWRQVDKLGQDTLPFPNRDWPLPIPPYRIEQTTAFNPIYYVPPGAPQPAGIQIYDLTPPDAPRASDLRTWIQSVNAALVVTPPSIPRNQFDWPLTPAAAQPALSWTWRQVDKLGLDTLPFPNRDWPLPQQPFRIDPTWTWRQVGMLGQDQLPNRQQDWPLTPPPLRIDESWAWRQVDKIGLDLLPNRQQDWPLPSTQLPFRPDFSWIAFAPPTPTVVSSRTFSYITSSYIQ